jgi:hypothetical protein
MYAVIAVIALVVFLGSLVMSFSPELAILTKNKNKDLDTTGLKISGIVFAVLSFIVFIFAAAATFSYNQKSL